MMTELAGTIKTGSIVLYTGNRGESDIDMVYYSVGQVGAPCCDPKRWLVGFSQQCFACNEDELIFLMNSAEKMVGKPIRKILKEFKYDILAAALRRLKHAQQNLNALHDQALLLARSPE